MALRQSACRLSRKASQAVTPSLASKPSQFLPTPKISQFQARSLASVAHPVTQNSDGSKGPTAMVFLNMGGPSTVDEVGDFLSRLFVCPPLASYDFLY